MRFFSFHYMTYTGLDAAKAIEDHGVGWCTLPNSLADGRAMAHDWNNYLDQAAFADEVGFDGVAVNEHHQTAFGTMPNPNVMAAALTQRTKRARIGVFGNALPLRASPLQSIEEYSMLDVLSNGRIEAGFVVGGGPEYYNFAQSPADARGRFAEALSLARKAWTEPGPFRWDGQHYQYDIVNPWPVPVQTPHPPVWICGVGSPSTMDMCARENLGYLGVNTNVGHEDFVGQCEYFRKAADRYGREFDPGKIGWLCHVHIADSDELAIQEFMQHSAQSSLLTRGFAGPYKTYFPPGHMPPDKLALWERHTRNTATGKSAVERDPEPLFGSPDTVADRMIRRLKEYQIGNLVIAFQWGSMPQEMVLRSMRRFAEDVMPRVRAEVGGMLDELYPNRSKDVPSQEFAS